MVQTHEFLRTFLSFCFLLMMIWIFIAFIPDNGKMNAPLYWLVADLYFTFCIWINHTTYFLWSGEDRCQTLHRNPRVYHQVSMFFNSIIVFMAFLFLLFSEKPNQTLANVAIVRLFSGMFMVFWEIFLFRRHPSALEATVSIAQQQRQMILGKCQHLLESNVEKNEKTILMHNKSDTEAPFGLSGIDSICLVVKQKDVPFKSQDTCSICLDAFFDDDLEKQSYKTRALIKLHCRHVFHFKCITTCVEKSQHFSLCPICKINICTGQYENTNS